MNTSDECSSSNCCQRDGVVVRWFPPSWVFIDAGEDGCLHIDPVFGDRPITPDSEMWSKRGSADGILITHRHADHYDKLTMKEFCKPESIIAGTVDASTHSTVVRMREGDEISIKNILILAVPAYNTAGGSSRMKVHSPGTGLGFIVKVRGVTVYHAGDTDLVPELEKMGPVDLAFVPIGGCYTMGPDEAVRTVNLLGAKAAVPIHWCQRNPQEFQQAATNSFSGTVVIPKPGRPLGLDRLGIL